MPIRTRYRISDTNVTEVRSFPVLREMPYFLRSHRRRLRSIGDLIAVVSGRSQVHPTYVRLTAFHRHRTPYAAIDALAPPLADFFAQTNILPIVEPIFSRYEDLLEVLDPRRCFVFAKRGILIPRELLNED